MNGFDGSETAYGDVALELSRFLDTAGINFDLDLFASESQVFPTLSPETLQPATFDDPHPSIPNEDMGEGTSFPAASGAQMDDISERR